jgi:hypothetical protein
MSIHADHAFIIVGSAHMDIDQGSLRNDGWLISRFEFDIGGGSTIDVSNDRFQAQDFVENSIALRLFLDK